MEHRTLPALFQPLASAVDGAANSLRSAITAANATPEDDTIVLQAGVYGLTIANSGLPENANATGDLDLNDPTSIYTIQGQGIGVTIIDGNHVDRIFDVHPGSILILRDLTIRNGTARDSGSVNDLSRGGGILVEGTPSLGTFSGLSLERVEVSDNEAISATGDAQGGGIFSNFAVGTIASRIVNNRATAGVSSTGDGGAAEGGGVFLDSLGIAGQFFDTIISGNSVTAGDGAAGTAASPDGGAGGSATGAGLFLRTTNLSVQFKLSFRNCVISNNTATAGDGGAAGTPAGGAGGIGGSGGFARGGGVFVQHGDVDLLRCTITGNVLQAGGAGDGGNGAGGNGGDGGTASFASGGGLLLDRTDSGTLKESTVANNLVTGGAGGNGGNGALTPGGVNGLAGFDGGVGGGAGPVEGGGITIDNATFAIEASTIANNQLFTAKAGNGGNGGNGGPNVIALGTGGQGGDGGDPGNDPPASGAGIVLTPSSVVTMTNSTVSGNTARGAIAGNGGSGGSGGAGATPGAPGVSKNGGTGNGAGGGGITLGGSVIDIRNSTIAFNQALPGIGGLGGAGASDGVSGGGIGGGLFIGFPFTNTVRVDNSIFAFNAAASSPEVSGDFTTASFNLLRDGTGSNLTLDANPDVNGNRVGSPATPLDPLLGPLAFNGGPTQTHALLAGSLAINNGSNPHALTTDQRGFLTREVGGAADIGAFEFGAVAPHLFAVGAGDVVTGSVKQLQVFNADGTLKFAKNLFNRSATHGVRVAVGDLNGDFFPDIVAAPGSGVAPRIFVLDGRTGNFIGSFLAYGVSFKKGVFVAVGDVLPNDGIEIVVAPGDNIQKVRVFSAQGQLLAAFRAFGTSYRGPVTVAAANLDFTGQAEIVVARGGGVPVAKTVTGLGQPLRSQTFPSVRGTPFLAAGDVNADNQVELILGDESGAGSDARIFRQAGVLVRTIQNPFGAGFAGGVRVGLLDHDNDHRPEVLIGPGPKGGRRVKLFDGITGALVAVFTVFPASFNGGMFVAGSV